MAVEPNLPLSRLLNALDFSPEEVVSAAAQQPRLFMQVVDYRMQKYRRRTEAKTQRELIRAEKSLELRQLAKQRDERLTEATIEAMLLSDKEVVATDRAYNAAEEAHEYAWLLLEAFRQRRDCLRIVSDLVGSEIAMQKAVAAGAEKVASVRKKLQKKWPSN